MKFTKRELPKHEGNGSSNYLKLSDGQSSVGTPRGDVYEYWQKWPKGGQKEIFNEPVPGSQSRFKLNFVTKDESGKVVAKVWEFGLTVYNQLAEISENFDMEKTVLKITRRGSGTDTQWIIIPLGPVANLKAIESVPLQILNGAQASAAPSSDEPEIPF